MLCVDLAESIANMSLDGMLDYLDSQKNTGGEKRSRRAVDFPALPSTLHLDTLPPYTKLIDRAEETRKRRQFAEAVAEHGERSVLIMRVNYVTDGITFTPSFCDHNCIETNMWTGESNVNKLFTEVSNGLTSFPRSMGRIVDVTVEAGQYATAACKFWEIGLEADAAVVAQHGINPTDYDHRSYFIPQQLGGCTFGGLGYVGCSSAYCKTWIRQPAGGTLGHELGHNLGVWHSSMDYTNDGVQENEYGDNSDLMGSTTNWRGLNAPHRMVMHWLDEITQVEAFESWDVACTAPQQLRLASLSTPSADASIVDDGAAVRMSGGETKLVLTVPRKMPTEGKYYVSLRTSAGVDTGLATVWKNQVYIHYLTMHSTRFQTNTQLVTRLVAGQTFTDAVSKFTITVNDIDAAAGHADITFHFCAEGEVPTTTQAPVTTAPSTQPTIAPCTDTDANRCAVWNNDGYCDSASMYFPYMNANCRRSCGLCQTSKDAYIVNQPMLRRTCGELIEGGVKPRCGPSSDPPGLDCCEWQGTTCREIHRANVRTHEDIVVHKCMVRRRTSIIGLPDNATCTSNRDCENKCDKTKWICAPKPQLRTRRMAELDGGADEDEQFADDLEPPSRDRRDRQDGLDSELNKAAGRQAATAVIIATFLVAGIAMIIKRATSGSRTIITSIVNPASSQKALLERGRSLAQVMANAPLRQGFDLDEPDEPSVTVVTPATTLLTSPRSWTNSVTTRSRSQMSFRSSPPSGAPLE